MEALHRSPSPRPEGGSSRRRGGFVFLRPPSYPPPAEPPPRYSSALALAEPPPREPPSSCAGPFTLLSPSLPLYPPVCPLARHPSIDFVTNRLHPIPSGLPTSPSRRPTRSPLERYAPMRVCTLIYKCILFIHISRRWRHRRRHRRRRRRRSLGDSEFRTRDVNALPQVSLAT